MFLHLTVFFAGFLLCYICGGRREEGSEHLKAEKTSEQFAKQV